MNARSAGLGLAVLSAAAFGTSGTFASSLMAAGWSPGAAVVGRLGLAALVLTVPAVLSLRGRWRVALRSLPQVATYGLVAVAGSQLFYFSAVQHLSVGVALLTEYSGAVLVVLWCWLRWGQRPGRVTVAGVGLSIAGLLLALGVLGHQHVDGAGLLWGAAAAVALAVYFTVSARSAEDVPPIAMAWGGTTIGVLALLALSLVGLVPLRFGTTAPVLAGHPTSWLVPVAGLALISTVVAYVSGIGGARGLGARVASFVGLLEVVCAVGYAWLLLGQRPSLAQALGGAVIVGGIALVRVGDSRREPLAA